MKRKLKFVSKTYSFNPWLHRYEANPGVTRTVRRRGESQVQAQARAEKMQSITGSLVRLDT